jgi:hypothetical protein
MIDLCLHVSFVSLYGWQTLVIDTDMIYVVLNSMTIDAFQTAICNVDFIDMELAR